MREEFGARDPRSQMLRFHTQTAGVQLTAQQPEVNMARVTIQALAAVLGGTQSLHTNAYDEAIALPSEKAARLALRSQQVIAHETDLTATADPLAGSYAIESMTDDVEAKAAELITQIDERGGAVAAIEASTGSAPMVRRGTSRFASTRRSSRNKPNGLRGCGSHAMPPPTAERWTS